MGEATSVVYLLCVVGVMDVIWVVGAAFEGCLKKVAGLVCDARKLGLTALCLGEANSGLLHCDTRTLEPKYVA